MKDTNGQQLSDGAVDFIDDDAFERLLDRKPPDDIEVRDLLQKSLNKEALTCRETSRLLLAEAPEDIAAIFDAARTLKRDVYGNRIVLFAPLYIGNKCVNDCRYCAFRRSNTDIERRTLDRNELREQIEKLESVGHKRLILVFGEHPDYDADFIADTVRDVYRTRVGHGEIRRVNINAAPLDHGGYRRVKEAGIGTYQVFMETYHHATYARVHPAHTKKGDYLWRLDALSRAYEAGCDDVGIGALFGLHDWRFDMLGLIAHARHLQARYGVGPHTISFPRIRRAHGTELSPRHFVSDDDFKRLVAILRLSVPYTGLILTARETPEVRRAVMDFGVSQIDAGSRIELGGYGDADAPQRLEREQFELGDLRPLDEVVRELLEMGELPSWCTACYRLGRTGERFMEYAVPGFIRDYCTPNALTTLMEYLVDYASKATRDTGERRIQEVLANMEDGARKRELVKRLRLISVEHAHDLYY